MMSSMRWKSGVVGCALLFSGGCNAIECTPDLVHGVVLVITEEGGPRTEPIAIRYRVDGGAWVEIVDSRDECSARTSCEIGPELDGNYEIEVSRGPVTVTTFVEVFADRCHVQTVEVPVLIPNA